MKLGRLESIKEEPQSKNVERQKHWQNTEEINAVSTRDGTLRGKHMENKYSGKPEYSSAYWKALRTHLAQWGKTFGSWKKLGEHLNTGPDAYRKFIQGNASSLGIASLSVLRAKGVIPDEIEALQQVQEPCSTNGIEQATTKTTSNKPVVAVHLPLESFDGKTQPTRQASLEKGYSSASLRRMCKTGKLDYVLSETKRYLVVHNAKYEALPETEISRLRRENASLREENKKLKEKVETLQMEFNFAQESETPSNVDLKAVAEEPAKPEPAKPETVEAEIEIIEFEETEDSSDMFCRLAKISEKVEALLK